MGTNFYFDQAITSLSLTLICGLFGLSFIHIENLLDVLWCVSLFSMFAIFGGAWFIVYRKIGIGAYHFSLPLRLMTHLAAMMLMLFPAFLLSLQYLELWQSAVLIIVLTLLLLLPILGRLRNISSIITDVIERKRFYNFQSVTSKGKSIGFNPDVKYRFESRDAWKPSKFADVVGKLVMAVLLPLAIVLSSYATNIFWLIFSSAFSLYFSFVVSTFISAALYDYLAFRKVKDNKTPKLH